MTRYARAIIACFIVQPAIYAASIDWAGEYVSVTGSLSFSTDTFLGGMDYDSSGNPVLYNGTSIVRHQEGSWNEIYTPEGAPYGSFVKQYNGLLYFGESSNGTIQSVDPEEGEATLLETVSMNYDLAFDPEGTPYLSAPSPNSTLESAKNGVYLLDFDPETAPVLVVEVDGYSGPVIFDAAGNLYVATSIWGEPSDIFRFTAGQLADAVENGPLVASDGDTFCSGLPGAYDLASGPFGLLLLSETTTGTIHAIAPDGNSFPWAAPVDAYAGTTTLAYSVDQNVLAFVNSDYATFNELTFLTVEEGFIRGDANNDQSVDISDVIFILHFLFDNTQPPPVHEMSLDGNDDGTIDIADGVYLLSYLFNNGSEPHAPFPEPGIDLTF